MFIHVLSLVLCDLFPKMDVGRQKTTLVKDLMLSSNGVSILWAQA